MTHPIFPQCKESPIHTKVHAPYPTLWRRVLARMETLCCPGKIPMILGGKSFNVVIALFQEKGLDKVRALLFWVPPAIRAKAYTALARHLKRGGFFQDAVLIARMAYEQEPRPFRLKFLALSLDDAENVLEADDHLKLLPKETFLNLTEMVQALHIITDAAKKRTSAASQTSLQAAFLPRLFAVQYDTVRDEVAFEYVTAGNGDISLWIGQQEAHAKRIKTVHDNRGRSTSLLRRRFWVSLAGHENSEKLTVTIDGQSAKIVLQKTMLDNFTLSSIRAALSPPPFDDCLSPYANCWLFIDRDFNADDNAEHLYRYILNHHPDINAWFLLRKDSYDWLRLATEGFRMIPWQSTAHEEALLRCSIIVSSHSNRDVLRLRDEVLDTKPYIFLQHGVIKDDLSAFLNHKRFDLFVTSTHAEWDSICGEDSKYIFDKQIVQCLGLPRHDALLVDDTPCQRQILIMPTWRRNLVGSPIAGHVRTMNPNFTSSDYLQMWASFLNSERLYNMTAQYNYKIVFFPHAVIQPYIHKFNVPTYIQCITHAQSGIQKLFKSSALMITDYSSVAFEMAYIKRSVIYYQFDEPTFFYGATPQWGKGYFDYQVHGFGPVTCNENALLDALENQLQRQSTPEPQYLERMENTFAWRDGNNCSRVFDAISKICS